MDVMVPNAGRYVLAVSGGVDSVVLLDMLARQHELKLVVAHFDHGIRSDSQQDRQFVQNLADRYGVPFEYAEGRLGVNASEAAARQARYEFLRAVQAKHNAAALITAHHQDDVLETAILNLLRGTNRRGLTALADRHDIRRPLINVPKADIRTYATEQRLAWREDSTNGNEAYLRNYVRHRLIPRLKPEEKQDFLRILNMLRVINGELDERLASAVAGQRQLDRTWFTSLPHAEAREIMAAWLRMNHLQAYDARMLERAVIAAKTSRNGKRVDLYGGAILRIGQDKLGIEQPGVLANARGHV